MSNEKNDENNVDQTIIEIINIIKKFDTIHHNNSLPLNNHIVRFNPDNLQFKKELENILNKKY